MAHVDFYFDFVSPWAYLASTRIERLCETHGATLAWQPIDLDRVKGLVGRETAPVNSAQLTHTVADVQRWAARYGVAVMMAPRVPTTPALRGCFLARDAGCEAKYIHRVFQARWGDGDDLSDEVVLRCIAADCAMEFDTLHRALDGEDTASRLEATCQAAAERGVFGVPTVCIGDDLFWGNDRLDFVAEALARS